MHSARSTTGKLELPAKQKLSWSYKKARAVSKQPSTRRWPKKWIVLRKELANQDLRTHHNRKRKQLPTRRQSNQPGELASRSKRRITVLPERTGGLESQNKKRVNITSQPTSKLQSQSTRQIGWITIAWPSTNNQSQFTIAKAIRQSCQKGPANNHHATSNAKHKANANCNLRKKNGEQKAKHNRKTKSETTITNQNKTKWE